MNVSDTRIAKIKSLLGILKVMLPDDLNKLNMRILDGIKDKLQKLPKMNIQKYKVMPIIELLKVDIPSESRQSINTVNDYIKMLNALLKFAYEREAINRQYTVSLIKKTTSSREERHALDTNDLHLLMNSSNEKLRPMYKLLYYSGMRLSEIYKCNITNVDGIKCFDLTDSNTILKTKSSYRLIPVHECIKDNVDALLELAQSIRAGYASKTTSKIFNTKGKTLYSIRHSFATEMASKGVEAVVMSELLGHAHKDMTMGRYVKGFPVQILKQAVDVLPTI
jgi:integrase